MSALASTITSAMVHDNVASASVTLMGWDAEARQVWEYALSYGDECEVGRELRTGVGMVELPEGMLRTLASFLSAHAESSEDGENADLFTVSREATAHLAEAIYCEVGWE